MYIGNYTKGAEHGVYIVSKTAQHVVNLELNTLEIRMKWPPREVGAGPADRVTWVVVRSKIAFSEVGRQPI